MPLFHLTTKLVEMGLWELACAELDTACKTEVDNESKWAKAVTKRSVKKMSEVRVRMITMVEMLQLVHMHKQDPMSNGDMAMTHWV